MGQLIAFRFLQGLGGAVAMPASPEPYDELVRGLVAVLDRDLRRKHFERIVARTGLALDPAAAWLLIRLGEQPGTTLDALAGQSPFAAEALRQAAEELRAAGWIEGEAGLGRSRRRAESVQFRRHPEIR